MKTVLILLLIYLGWIAVGGGIIYLLSRYLGSRPVSLGKALAVQTLLSPLLILFLYGYGRLEGNDDPWPEEQAIDAACMIGAATLQFIGLFLTLRTSALFTLIAWIVYMLPVLIFLEVAMPEVHGNSIRPRITKTNGELRAAMESLYDRYYVKEELPLPENLEGTPLSALVDSATGEQQLYYEGAGFIPREIRYLENGTTIGTDPFSDRLPEMEPYRYGLGIYDATDAVFVLSSRGPDRESRAEEFEDRVLREMDGVLPSRSALDDLTYSPTNGTRSPGDIHRVGGQRFK